MPTPEEIRDQLLKSINDNPLPGQEGRADAIEGEPAIGIELDDELFFITVNEA